MGEGIKHSSIHTLPSFSAVADILSGRLEQVEHAAGCKNNHSLTTNLKHVKHL